MNFIIKSRRINYLHTILGNSDLELTRKIYKAQKQDPINGDWITLVKEDLKLVNIHLNDKEISEAKKS